MRSFCTARKFVPSPINRSHWSELCRAGRYRHRERAAAQRTAAIAGAADCDFRGASSYQQFPWRSSAGLHTMLEKAVRICDAKFGTLYLYEEGDFAL